MDCEIRVTKLKEEETGLLRKKFSRNYFLYNGYILPDRFTSEMDSILNMDVNDDDIWVCSFPKAGTTWTQEMVWCIANDVNITEAQISLRQRYIFLDFSFVVLQESTSSNASVENKLKDMLSQNEEAKKKNTRRFIKTHLPYELLPRKLRDGSTKAKIVYVTRNPRDTCISSYHHKRQMGRFNGDLEQFCDVFMKGEVCFGPYWNHVFGYRNRQNKQNLLFNKYEDMKKDLPSVIKRTAEFLGKFVNANEMDKLCEHLSFNSMKNNPALNEDTWTEIAKEITNADGSSAFFRRGKVDQWKEDFKPEITDQFEKWESENLQKVDLEQYSSL